MKASVKRILNSSKKLNLSNRGSSSQDKKKRIRIALYLLFFISIVIVAYTQSDAHNNITGGFITGGVTYGETQYESLVVNSSISGMHTIPFDKEIVSLKISGIFQGEGMARVYAVSGETKLLIYEFAPTDAQVLGTGFVVYGDELTETVNQSLNETLNETLNELDNQSLNISDNESLNISNEILDDSIILDNASELNSSNTSANTSLNTSANVSLNETENLDADANISNNMSQVLPDLTDVEGEIAEGEIIEDDLESSSVEMGCEETCTLMPFYVESILIEVEGGELFVDNFTYVLTEKGLYLQKNVSDINLNVAAFEILEMGNYFSTGAQYYDLSSSQGYSYEVNDFEHSVKIIGVEEGIWPAKIYSVLDGMIVESNTFNVVVNNSFKNILLSNLSEEIVLENDTPINLSEEIIEVPLLNESNSSNLSYVGAFSADDMMSLQRAVNLSKNTVAGVDVPFEISSVLEDFILDETNTENTSVRLIIKYKENVSPVSVNDYLNTVKAESVGFFDGTDKTEVVDALEAMRTDKTLELDLLTQEAVVIESSDYRVFDEVFSNNLEISASQDIGAKFSDGIIVVEEIKDIDAQIKKAEFVDKVINHADEIVVEQSILDAGMESVVLDLGMLEILKEHEDILKVYVDQPVTSLADESLDIIGYGEGVDFALENLSLNLNGSGVKICLLDTGIDSSVVLNNAVGYDFVNDNSDFSDDNGHGTKTAYIIQRMVPSADLIIAKVLDNNGHGYESTVIAGLQYCREQGADIISMSLGSGGYNGYCVDHPVASLVNELDLDGTLVVAATGNDGDSLVEAPACARSALAVGASTKEDGLASFTTFNNNTLLLAPGTDISTITIGGISVVASGTSMSVPFVTGVAAMIMQAESTFTVDQIKSRLIYTGELISADDRTFSRVDVYNALTNNVTNNLTAAGDISTIGDDGEYEASAIYCDTLQSYYYCSGDNFYLGSGLDYAWQCENLCESYYSQTLSCCYFDSSNLVCLASAGSTQPTGTYTENAGYCYNSGTANGQGCSSNSQCYNNNCRASITGSSVYYCADAGHQCSAYGTSGYESGETQERGDGKYLCVSTDNGGGQFCADSGANDCDEYGGYYCSAGEWIYGSSNGAHLGACGDCYVCGGSAAYSEGDLSCNGVTSGDPGNHCTDGVCTTGNCNGAGACANTGYAVDDGCGGGYACSNAVTRTRYLCNGGGSCAYLDDQASDCSGNCDSTCSGGACQNSAEGTDPYGICPDNGYYCDGQSGVNSGLCGTGAACGYYAYGCGASCTNSCINGASSCGSLAAGATNGWGGTCCDSHSNCAAGWFCETVTGYSNAPNYYSCPSTEYPDFGEPHCVNSGAPRTCEPSYDIGRGYIVQDGTDGDGGSNGYRSKTIGMNGNPASYSGSWWGHQISGQGGVGYKTTSADSSLCFAYVYDPCTLGGENYYKTTSSTATWHSHADQMGEPSGCNSWREWLDLGSTVSGSTYSLYQDAEVDYYTRQIYFGWKISEAGSHADGSSSTWCCESSTSCVDDAPARGTGGDVKWLCYDSGSHARDANDDGNTDYCSNGQWYDCVDNTDCSGGFICSSNDCVNPLKADGQACSADPECASGKCDNDGLAVADDGWCYTAIDTQGHCVGGNCMDGQESTCERDTGFASDLSDERGIGWSYDNRGSSTAYLGCPEYSQCYIGGWNTCFTYDGDLNSGTCGNFAGTTWTSITTGDRELDSTCDYGYTTCGDGVASNGFCCGDDASEFYRVEEAYSNPIGFDNDEAGCCDLACDCIAGGACYTNQGQSVGTSTGLNPGGTDDKSHCYCGSDSANVGRWLDCDQSDFMDVWCGDVCGPAKGAISPRGVAANESWNARYSGEWSAHGEYANKITLGCCGDDTGEYHRNGSASFNGIDRCCNAATDCVTSLGECVASGYMSTYNNVMYYCNGGVWNVTTYSPPRYEIMPGAHQGIVGYWDLNENAGTSAFDKTERNVGTFSGSPLWTSGQSNSGVNFSSNGYIRVPDSSLLDISGDMTVSMWVKLNNQGAQTMLDKATSTTGGVYIGYGWSSCGFIFGSDNQANAPCGTQQASDVGQWHHVVGTVSGSTRTLYVDGALVGTHSTGVNSWNNVADLTIGAGQNGTSGLVNGAVDEVQIYDRVLTANQIAELYNGTVRQRIAFFEDDPSLVLYLPFEETSGAVTHDYSQVNRDGTIVGATRTTGPAKFGNALSFDGSGDYIDFGDFFNYPQFTISVWLNPAATQNQYADIIDNNHDGDSNWVIQQYDTNTNWYGWGYSNFYLPANTWTHLVVMRDASYCFVYLNGVLYNYSTCAAVNYDSSPYRSLRIGGHISLGRSWNGVMDELRMYNRDYSDFDIANLYLAGRPNVTLYRSTSIGGTYNLVTDDGAVDTSFDTLDNGGSDSTAPGLVSTLDDGPAPNMTWMKASNINFTWLTASDTGNTYYYYGKVIGNVSTTYGSNLFARGFESGLQLPFTSAYATSTFATISSDKYEGLFSLQHTANGADSYNLPFFGQTSVIIDSNAHPSTLNFTIYAKGSSSGPIQLRIFCLDAAYNYATYGIYYEDKTVTTSWAPYSIVHTCPAGTQYASVRVDNDLGAGGTVYWDSPLLYEVKNNTVISGLDGYALACDQSASTAPTGKDIESTSSNYSCSFSSGINYFHIRSIDNAGNLGNTVHSAGYYVCTDADGTVDSDNDGIGLTDAGDGCGCTATDAQTPDDCDPGVDGTTNGVCVLVNNGGTYDCEIDGTEICYGGTYYENDCTYCSYGSSCDSNGGTAYSATGVCAGASNADCNVGPVAADTTTSITASSVFGADTAACAVSYVGRYCDIVTDGAFSASNYKRCARGGESSPFGDYAAGTNYGCCGNVGTEFYRNASCLSSCTSNASDIACCGTATDCVYSTSCYAAIASMTAPWNANQRVSCATGNWSLVQDCSTANSVDSDSGDLPYVAGIVTDYTTSGGATCNSNTYTDACLAGGQNLTEYNINGASYTSKLYNCSQFEVLATDTDSGNNIAVAGTCSAGVGISCNNGAFSNNTGTGGTDGRVGTCGTGIDTCNYTEYYPVDTSDNCTGADTCMAATHDCDEHLTACTACIAAGNWLTGGEASAFGEYADLVTSECCGDDSGENLRSRIANAGMDNGYATLSTDDACCAASSDCIDDAICVNSANVTRDADGDGDNDYCNAGTWYDCNTNAECGAGYYCSSNNCLSSTISVNFTSPTPPDNYRSIASSVSINVSVVGVGFNVSGCRLQWNNTNYTMQMVGTGLSVICNLTMPTTNGGVYTYMVYANNTANTIGNTSTRTLTENTAPALSSVALTSTNPSSNDTDANLTLTFSVSDAQSDNVFNFTDWRRNGTSIAVLNMPFDENVTSTAIDAVNDYSTYDNDGTLASSTSTPTWNATGRIGGAFSFDGGDYITIQDDDELSFTDGAGQDEPFSISFWVNPRSTGDQWFINKRGATQATQTEWQVQLYSGNFSFSLFNGGSNAVAMSATMVNPLTLNQWNYITATYDGSENENGMDIYFNGVKQSTWKFASGAYSGMSPTTAEVTIGKAGWGSSLYLNGMMDEVKVFDRSLSTEQIYQEYLAGLNNRSTNILVANETEASDNWTVLAGACDGYECSTSLSNGVFIADLTENCNPPVTGNWILDGNETCSNRNITITNGNVTIDAGDVLTLRNATLTMNFTGGNYIQRVLVTNGGELRLINTTYGLHTNGAYYVYVDSNTGGIVNFTNSNTTSAYVYWRQYGPARLYLQSSRMGGVYWTYYANPAIVATSSYFNDFRPTVEDNSAITVNGLREDVALNMNISSTSTGHSFNFTTTTFNTFYITITDGNWTMGNSTITYIAVGNNNNYRKVLNQSATAYFYYTHNSGLGGLAFNNYYPGRTRIVETLQSSGNNNPLVLEEFNITNYLYFYTYSPTNFTNTTMYYYYPYAGSDDYFRNSTVTYRTYATGASKTRLENSSLAGGGYTLISATGLFNFTQPAQNNSLGRIYVSGGGTRYIHGYVNFTYGISNWAAGLLVNRFFPINITDDNGFPIPGATINLANASGAVKSSGVTGTDGIAWVNMTDDDNTTIYQLLLGTNWQKNITMLEGTAPYGLEIEVSAPAVSATSLLPATPYDGNDLIANVTCTDSVYNPLTVFWKVFRNGAEQAVEAGSSSITQGVSTNVKNISASSTSVGDNVIVEFICQNDYVNGTAVNTSTRTIVNRIPIISSVVLNFTSQLNNSAENLTLYYSGSDPDGHALYNFTDWRKNGTSIAVVNMPFNANVSSISAGAVVDYSSYGNNGTLGGGTASYAPTWNASGKIGGSYSFNGDDYMQIQSINAADGITASAWVNPTSVSSRTLFSIGSQSSSAGYHWLYFSGSGIINWQYANGSSPRTSSYSTTIPLNTWTLITITHNYSTNVVKFYVNGTLKQTTDNVDPALSISAKYVRIGAYAYNNMPFTGNIDEAKIFDRVISPEQIYQEYLAGVNNLSTNTIVSNETAKDENWTAQVGLCDGYNCTTQISNGMLVRSSDPYCGMGFTTNGVYNLTGNISAASGNCLSITPTSANVVIDCKGNSIIGNHAAGTNGIYITAANTTIKNCNIKNFNTDITLLSANSSRISNTTMGTPIGLLVNNTNNGIYSNLTFTNITSRGIYVTGTSNNNTFTNISIEANGGSGIYVDGGVNNTFDCMAGKINGTNAATTYGLWTSQFNTTIKNCIITNFSTGIYFSGADNGIISNTSVRTIFNFGYGVYIFSNANYNNILNTSILSVNGPGLFISGSSNNSIISSFGNSSSRNGIILTSSNNNSFVNSQGSSLTNSGINLTSSSRNVFVNVNGTSTSEGGIFLDTSHYNSFTSCRGASSSGAGLYLFLSTSNYFTYFNATAPLGLGTGIAFIFGSSDNSILNSSATSNNTAISIVYMSNRNIIADSTGTSITGSGIGISLSSDNNLIANFTGTSTSHYGIEIDGSSYNNVTNSSGTSTSKEGIILNVTTYSRIISSNATSSSSVGMNLTQSANSIIINTSFNSDSGIGLSVENSTNMSMVNSNATSLNSAGMIVSLGGNHRISYSNILGNDATQPTLYFLTTHNNSLMNSSIVGGGQFLSTAVEISGTNNTIFNNTLSNAYMLLRLDTDYGNNLVYWNNFTIPTDNGLYIACLNDTNQFNKTNSSGTNQGNFYEEILTKRVYDRNLDGWGDNGPDYPVSGETWGIRFNGLGADYAPATTRTNPFSATWDTRLNSTGSSNKSQIKLPLEATGTYNFYVDWGDGTGGWVTSYDEVDANHSYATQGVKTINITGTIIGFRFNGGGDAWKIMNITSWGDLRVGNNGDYFEGCLSLNFTGTDNLDLTGTTDFTSMFAGASNFSGNISGWDVSNVTDMSSMFWTATSFNGDIGSWNVGNVTDFNSMFLLAQNFNKNISGWNTAKATTMTQMFWSASSFNQTISTWNTANVTDMSYMFRGATVFNQNLSRWNTSKVTTMTNMFYLATSFNGDISGWDTSKVTTMYSMFEGALVFNKSLSSWNTSNVVNMAEMFWNAQAFNQNLSSWDVRNLTNASNMFHLVTLSRENYDSLLTGWGSRIEKNGTVFSGGNSQYTIDGLSGRNNLTNLYNWSITDGGFYEQCDYPASGDWDVVGHKSCSNTIVDIVNGDLNIGSGASLTLTNATLRMNITSSAAYGIRIDDGGVLTTTNSRIYSNSTSMYAFLDIHNGTFNATNTNTSDQYLWSRQFTGSKLYLQGSRLNGYHSLYLQDGVVLNITGFRANTIMNLTASSTTTTFVINLSNSLINQFYNIDTYDTNFSLINSQMTMLYVYNSNNSRIQMINSTSTQLVYHNDITTLGTMNITGWYPRNAWTVIINTSGNHYLIYNNSDVSTGFTIYTSNPMNINNSILYRYEGENGNDVYFKDSIVNYRAVFNRNSKQKFENTSIESSTYTLIQNDTTLNFTQPAYNNKLRALYIDGAGTRIIYGYVNFTGGISVSNTWVSGEYINRFFPVNISQAGIAFSGKTIDLRNSSGSTISTGTTGANGIAFVNVTDDDNTTIYQIFVNGTWRDNITLLEDTAPYGLVFAGDISGPSITFESPTPADGALWNSTNISIVANISDDSNSSAWLDFDRSLLGYWSMDSLNATVVHDNSTWNNHAIYFGGLSASDSKTGIRGNALDFDGSNDLLAVSHNDNLNVVDSVTISVWVKMDGRPAESGENMNIVSKYSLASPSVSYRMQLYEDALDTTQVLFGVVNSSDTYFNGLTWQNLTVGKWYNIVGTLNSTRHLKIYINGVDVTDSGPQVYGNMPYTNSDLVIGSSSTSLYRFNGSIDEVMIFNRSLSPSEIMSLYSATAVKLNTSITNLSSGSHTYRASAVDAYGNRNSSALRTVTINPAPVIVSSAILPSPANTTDILRGNCNATDNQNVNYYYRWYRNGVLNASGSTAYFAPNVTRNVNNLTAGIQSKWEVWILSCLAGDGALNSSWLNSTPLNISNSPPSNVSLVYPGSGNDTFTNRTPRFIWTTALDADSDTLTYTINVSTSPAFVDSVYSKSGISTLYQDYDLPAEMAFGTYYWKVIAHDGTINGSYSSTFNFTLVSSVNVQMINDNVTFGSLVPGLSNNTLTDNPAPFVIKSYSNTYIDMVNMSVSKSLWTLHPLNTSYWQMRVRSKSDGSFNQTGSKTTFFNVTNTTDVVKRLNYTYIRNNVTLDVNVTAPMYEGPGAKTSTLGFYFEVAS